MNKFLLASLFLILLQVSALPVSVSEVGPSGGYIRSIKASPGMTGTYFVLNSQNEYVLPSLFRTTDNGNNWKLALSDVWDVAVHPTTFSIFAVTNSSVAGSKPQRVLWQSTDDGATFTSLATIDFALRGIRFDPARPNVIYGFGRGRIDLVMSTDGGLHWVDMTTLPYKLNQYLDVNCYVYSYEFSDLIVPAFASDALYASADVWMALPSCSGSDCDDCGDFNVLMKSTNQGRTWSVEEGGYQESLDSFSFYSDVRYRDRFFVESQKSLSLVTAAGKRVVHSQNELDRVMDVAAHPSDPNLLLMVQYSAYGGIRSLFRSQDGGNTWAYTGVKSKNILSVGFLNHLDESWLVGTTEAGLLLFNRTLGWRAINDGFHRIWISEIALSPQRNVLLATVPGPNQSRFLLRSQDLGRTWSLPSSSSPFARPAIWNLASDPFRPDHVLANADGYLVESLDAGQTWKNIATKVRFQAFDPFLANVVYLSRERTLLKSTAGGATAVAVISLPDRILRVVPDAALPGKILILTEKKIYASFDSGVSVSSIPFTADRGCTGCDLYPLDIEALLTPDSYLLSLGVGIFRTSDGGKSWKKVSSNSCSDFVRALPLGSHYFCTGFPFIESINGGLSWRVVTKPYFQEGSYVSDMTDPTRTNRYYLAGKSILEVSP